MTTGFAGTWRARPSWRGPRATRATATAATPSQSSAPIACSTRVAGRSAARGRCGGSTRAPSPRCTPTAPDGGRAIATRWLRFTKTTTRTPRCASPPAPAARAIRSAARISAAFAPEGAASLEPGAQARDLADRAPVLVLEPASERGDQVIAYDRGERQGGACVRTRVEEQVDVLQPGRQREADFVERAVADAIRISRKRRAREEHRHHLPHDLGIDAALLREGVHLRHGMDADGEHVVDRELETVRDRRIGTELQHAGGVRTEHELAARNRLRISGDEGPELTRLRDVGTSEHRSGDVPAA